MRAGVHEPRMRGIIAMLIVAFGCGDDDGMPMLDGGLDASLDAPVEPPTEPTAPEEPSLVVGGACPAGWTLIETEGLPSICEPYADGFDDCEDHEAHFLGEAGCRTVGRACADGFPEAPADATGVLYVQAGSSGDGTEGSPFGTIAEALAAASAGDAILIAGGTYDEEALVVNRTLTIRGACSTDTRIIAPSDSEAGAIFAVLSEGVVIEDLQLGGPRMGIRVEEGASAEVRGVAFVNVEEAALVGYGDLTVEDVVVRTSNDRLAGAFSVGVAAYDGAELEVRRSVFRGQLDLSAQVRGATATFEDVLFGAHFIGLIPMGGRGLEAGEGATVTVRRAVFDVNADIGALSADADTTLTLEDTYFAEILGEIGASIAAIDGASATLSRTYIVAPVPAGIVSARGADVRSEDLIIEYAGAEEYEGYGIQVSDDARVELTRSTIFASRTAGVSASGGEIALNDLAILDVGTGGEYELDGFAFGLVLTDGADAILERASLQGCDIYGMAVSESSLVGRDLSTIATFSHPLTAVGGALWMDAANVELDRVLLEDNQNASLVTFGGQTTLRDLIIRRTFRGGCIDRRCESFVGGVGIGAYGGAQVDVVGFEISDNELIGAQVAFGVAEDGETPLPEGGVLSLDQGTIEGNLVGVNVQIPDYDFDRFQNVVFVDNERNFDSTLMGVPAPPGL